MMNNSESNIGSGKVDIVMGISWGDEAKVKIADAISDKYKYTARYSGSNNCGGTAYLNGKKVVLNLIPAGILQKKISIIGNGVLVNPIALVKELEMLEKAGIENPSQYLVISNRAFLTLPVHIDLDNMSETSLGEKKIGTTGKGVTPSAISRLGREGLRVGDIPSKDFYEQYMNLTIKLIGSATDTKTNEEFFDACDYLIKNTRVLDTSYYINQILKQGYSILCNGNQGTMLDFMFTPTYPYCSSTGNTIGSVCTGLGISHDKIGCVFGVAKFYTTRVGSGHFTGCLDDTEVGKHLQKVGNEFGAVTGRPRSVSWINLPEIRYACMINGVTDLCLTKGDVLDGMETFKAIVGYEKDGKKQTNLPFNLSDEYKPIYKTFEGWDSVTECKTLEELPGTCVDFLRYIKRFTDTNITYISTGVESEATMKIEL